MQHLRGAVAVCETTMQHLHSPVAVCETATQHLHSVVAVCETTMQHLHNPVAVCEMTMHHLHSLVAVCEAIMQHLHSVVAVCERITQHLHSLFVMCVPTRVQSFIPAGCLGGECNSPLHGYNHSSLWDVWGGECNSPLHEVPGKFGRGRLQIKKCRTGFTAGPAPMKKVIDMNTPPKKEEILLCVSFRPCNPRATPGRSPR